MQPANVAPQPIDPPSDCLESGEVRSGRALPWGTCPLGDGVNFAIFSRYATSVRLEFYAHVADALPSRTIELKPPRHRTGDVWHVWVRGVRSGQLYSYRLDGPYQPRDGHRFNPHKLLLDPFTKAIARNGPWDFVRARGYDPASDPPDISPSRQDDAASMPKSVFVHNHFDWEDDQAPRHAASDLVIYETHVRGCTVHSSSGVTHPGTYRGLVEMIPYFQDLGITAVELMPIQEFNEDELVRVNALSGERLKNYWGYNPVAFFAPKASYSSSVGTGTEGLEFKQMVKAFHRAGIEVIVDVVLNHTAEGNEVGPTICFRGIENSVLYMLKDDKRFYRDYTGVGNTLNANHPVVRDYIIDVLRYWAMDLHVDGFRFDLASVLGRDEHGNLLSNPPLLEAIAEDPILRDVKLIAEAWDQGGAYQVGSFSERRWAEWNGRFRDDVRRFWLGEPGMISSFASRISGSADLYQGSGKGPDSSVNFVTCHDGFTLNDLVSYRNKHNLANGEDNRDGVDANYSENCGQEGSSTDPAVEVLRNRLIKNYLLTMLISRGIPMLLGGDEFRRTQQGNNNAYCQDNEISWYDWKLLAAHGEIHRFTRAMIAFRRRHSALRQAAFYSDADLKWLVPAGATLNWFDPQQRSLACLVFGRSGGRSGGESEEQNEPNLFLMFNASSEPVDFRLPAAPEGGVWYLAVDTFRPSPDDCVDFGKELPLEDQKSFRSGPRSSAILISRP